MRVILCLSIIDILHTKVQIWRVKMLLFDNCEVCSWVCQSPFRLLENATDTFSYHVAGLSPYVQYSFRVVVGHTHGQTVSSWATLLTAEDGRFPYPHTHTHIQWAPFADSKSIHVHVHNCSEKQDKWLPLGRPKSTTC